MYTECPNCDRFVGGSAFRAALKRCSNCGKIYCNYCGDGDFGRECPDCGTENAERAADLEYYK